MSTDRPDFYPISSDGTTGLVKKNSGLDIDESLASIPDLFSAISVIKEEPSRSIFSATLLNQQTLFCKSYRDSGIAAMLRAVFKGNRAQQSHDKVNLFTAAGATAPQSMGYVIKKTGLLARESVHFSEYLEDAKTLYDFVATADDQELSHVLSQVAQQLARVHSAGYVHGDTKLHNLLIDNASVYFVDLDSVRAISKKYSPARDLARLLVGLSEASIEQSFLAGLMEVYYKTAAVDKKTLASDIRLIIPDFQKKHLKKYGRKPSVITF